MIEFARNVVGISGATSEEFMQTHSTPARPVVDRSSTMGPTANSLLPRPCSVTHLPALLPAAVAMTTKSEHQTPVIMFMPEIDKNNFGGTMRLGSRATVFSNTNSIICKAYGGEQVIHERHRHRYIYIMPM